MLKKYSVFTIFILFFVFSLGSKNILAQAVTTNSVAAAPATASTETAPPYPRHQKRKLLNR